MGEPDSAGYRRAVPDEMSQFRFLIGEWDYVGSSIQSDDSGHNEFTGFQQAEYHFGGRMIIEKYYRYLPGGEVNLMGSNARTYSVARGQWQSANQPAGGPGILKNASARWVDGEMGETGTVSIVSWLPFGLPFRARFFDITEDSYRWKAQVWALRWRDASGIDFKRRGS